MATTTILRRSISYVLPLAVVRRTVERRNHHHSALFTALYQYGSSSSSSSTLSHKPCPRPFASTLLLLHFYSSSSSSSAEKETSSADDPLVRAVKSNIKSVEESADHEAKVEVPNGFPFEIQDNPGQETISLAREYQGEVIEAELYLSRIPGEGDDDLEAKNIPLDISVSKKNGTSLWFVCTAVPNEIIIDFLYLYLEDGEIAPFIPEMEENIREAFQKYLEIRGIKPSIYNFLSECMSKKKSKEHALWLKNVNKFVGA